jgi:hypothetical protein
MEGTDTGWMSVLEKKGLHQATGLLENYGIQLERMKAVRIFNPLHVLGNKISESDIGGLKIFKSSED